jgi:hypothetical protein
MGSDPDTTGEDSACSARSMSLRPKVSSKMRTDWLSVALVEEIHRAITRRKPVADVVTGLCGATLPGLLEYGCLRRTYGHGVIPPLPAKIIESDLGKALKAVRSVLRVRASGSQKPSFRRHDPQSAEFHVVAVEDDIATGDWQNFTNRFDASARSVGHSFEAAARLHSALDEMAENAVIHAQAPAILVGYHVLPGRALFCVVDVGIGVLASLHKNSAYGDLHLHGDAIRAALQDGVTSCLPGDGGGGFGFRKVFNSLTDQWGSLRFRSGEACLSMDGTNLDTNLGAVRQTPVLLGFQVTVCCQTDVGSSQSANELLI